MGQGDRAWPDTHYPEMIGHVMESTDMRVIVASHPSSLLHDTGPRHPERPDRVEAVRRGVAVSGLEVVEIEPPSIRRSELALVHEPTYIEMVEVFCKMGGGALDRDTVVSAASWEAALSAVGAVRVATEELESRGDATGLAICRPPGHHALSDRAMGFCLFNNVAVSAALLRSQGKRVAVLDWDVHHGNGTQAMLGNDPGVLYVSIHQDNFYPFEGHISDIDGGEAKGTNVNLPVPAGTAGDIYRRAWEELIMPVLGQFAPDWVFVSAGFDAHASDPLAEIELTADDYGWLASRLSQVHPPHRIVVALEGGYDLTALERSTAATLRGLAGVLTRFEEPRRSPKQSITALDQAAAAIARHWEL